MSGLISTVILAGGKAKPDMIAATGQENRALVVVGGRAMLETVVEALAGTSGLGRIVVVGDLPASSAYTQVADHGGFVENLFAGVDATEPSEHILIATADVPFLTPEVVSDFVRGALELGADVVYPVVDVEECYRRFPGVKRTAVPLREGRFTGGNMMLVRRPFLLRQRSMIGRAYDARKRPLQLAMMLGLGTVFRAALAMKVSPKALSIGQMEDAAGRMLGGTARAYVSRFPEIATDIDRPSDLEALASFTPRE